MHDESILTIGILTYNRPRKLHDLMEGLSRARGLSRMPVLVIDDGSEPATAAVAAEFAGNPNVVYAKNETNVGFPRSLLRLLELCQTEYMLLAADDDLVETENLQTICDLIRGEKPDLLSPIYSNGGVMYRGARETRLITPSEYIKCSGHASGLIFRVSAFKALAPQIMIRLRDGKADAICYPQVLFAIATLLDQRKALYINVVSAFDNGNMTSGVLDANRTNYWEYSSRLRQFAAFYEFISDYATNNEEVRGVLLRAHREEFVHRVIYAWMLTDRAAHARFERRIIRNYVRRRVAKCMPEMLKKSFRRLGV